MALEVKEAGYYLKVVFNPVVYLPEKDLLLIQGIVDYLFILLLRTDVSAAAY